MRWRLLNADWNFWPDGLSTGDTWARCVELGFAGIEVGVYDSEVELSDDRMHAFRLLRDRHGLAVSGILFSLPPGRWPDGAFSSKRASARAVDEAIAIGRRAAELGLDFVGIWPGGDVRVADDDVEARWRRLVESAGAVTETLAADGIRVAVEYKPRDLVADPATVLRLCREVDAGTIGALLDTGHALWAGEDLPGVVRALDGHIIHIHLGDSPLGAEGDFPPGRYHDFGAFFEALAGSSYDGALSFDMYGSIDEGIVTGTEASREALAHVRAACTNIGVKL